MFRYKVFGSLIESNIALPELLPAPEREAGKADFRFHLRPPQSSESGSERREYAWFHHWRQADEGVGGEILCSCAKHDGGYVLRYPAMADFHLSADCREIGCAPEVGIPLETIRHFLLDQVLPSALGRREGVVLHGSAIVIGDQAVAFVGQSGHGKSTLAASFCLNGHALLTDDGLLVTLAGDKARCAPSYPGLRLWPASAAHLLRSTRLEEYPLVTHYHKKHRLRADQAAFGFLDRTFALKRIYFLASNARGEGGDEKAEIRISPMAPQDSFRELFAGIYRLDVTDRDELRHQFSLVSAVAAAASPRRLAYPRRFSLLARVRQAVLADLEHSD